MKVFFPYNPDFPSYLKEYANQIRQAIRSNKHHDFRRHLFLNFMRMAFGVDPVEVKIEEKVKVEEVRGRIDALFKSIIFEFKTNIEGERPAAKVEMKKYFEGQEVPSDYLAVLTDGLRFEIYQYVPGRVEKISEFSISPSDPFGAFFNIDKILFASKPAPPSAEDLSVRFGPFSAVYHKSRLIMESALDRVNGDAALTVKFNEWNTLLSRVYGEKVGDRSLFITHTYLAILIRVLVAIALFPKEFRNSEAYKGMMTGEYFARRNLLNLVEPDFFSWAIDTPVEADFLGLMSKIEQYLNIYDLSRINSDILKEIYQDLVDPSSRHSLGEYYTPDWIADIALRRLEYKKGTILDPSCGSGTFLVAVVRRYMDLGLEGSDLVNAVVKNVVGIDVHPLAVMMTKINILLSLSSDLMKISQPIYLPVYMADTLLVSESSKRKTIRISVSEDEEFNIPLDTIGRGLDLDHLLNELLKIAQLSAKSESEYDTILKGLESGLLRGFDDDELFFWKQNFKLMTKLIKANRDSVWNFILKNSYKPAYLRHNKVSYVVGNPPWLAYRYVRDSNYKAQIKQLTLEHGLLDKGDIKLFTQMDTSTLFFLYSQKHFLRENGKIALVMPKTTVLPSKQHVNFQKTGFTEIHDFTDVTPLFNVRAVLAIKKGKKVAAKDVPIRYYTGTLPAKNLDWEEAAFHLEVSKGKWSLREPKTQSPYYHSRFAQGATIVPRCFWFVQPDPVANPYDEHPYFITSDSAFKEAKEPWRTKINMRIDKDFLFETILANALIPFGIIRRELIFLPVRISKRGYEMQDINALAENAKYDAWGWLQAAEEIWKKHRTNEDITLLQWLNYRNKVTAQKPNAGFIVLYNTSGTNLTAAVYAAKQIKPMKYNTQGFVADAKTYYYYPKTLKEGDFLCAVLNSDVVNDLIKEYQNQGLFGPRDIHRRPFEVCPIPEYDRENQLHAEISELGKKCRLRVGKLLPELGGRIGTVRKDVRRKIEDEIKSINEAVDELLKGGNGNPTAGSTQGSSSSNIQSEIIL